MVDVVVVGSGPNGLAAAVTMARAGLEVTVFEAQDTIGGGARTLELGLADGIVHDVCSAVHPMALASPFLREFDLPARGVNLRVPELSYAQPLDGGRAGLAWRDLGRTVDGLGRDGAAWRRLLGPVARHADATVVLALGDKRTIPRGPGTLAAAGGLARGTLSQGTRAWDLPFAGEVAPALLTGVAAHAIAPLPGLVSAGTALLLAGLAHAGGWPVPVGGSRAITDALVKDLVSHGGSLRTGMPITSWRNLPQARAYLLDTSPRAAAGIWRDRLARRTVRALERFRHGGGAAKVDFVLSGPVPWTAGEIGGAGAVHVCGSRAEMAAAEAAVAAGRHADRPMVLLSDPVVCDPGREVAGLRPLWTYAHVPHGSDADVTAAVVAQIERFAPGFRDLVVASLCVPAARMSRHNANSIGGDIAGGAVTARRMLTGARPAWNPYRIGVPGVYLCSASVPPGPGVHGLSGWYAARAALRDRFGMTRMPTLAPSGAIARPVSMTSVPGYPDKGGYSEWV